MPVSTMGSIFYTIPIWATIFGRVLLKEDITRLDYFQIIFAFIGVIVINDPFGQDYDTG
jgi:drug/metabolite transporter (DMT)-like permease